MCERITKLCEILNSGEAAIINGDINRLYLSGFKSSAGTVLLTRERGYLLIDFRYYEKAKERVKNLEVLLCQNLYKQITEILKNHEIKTVYLESNIVSISAFASIKQRLADFKVCCDDKVSRKLDIMRRIKSEDEIAAIIKAQQLTDEAFANILPLIKIGATERQIALEMEFSMRKNGSEGVAFDFIVVSGKNSSLPHGVPTDKPIEKGDFVTMDFGALIEGYRSDMTRTVAVGEVTPLQKKVYDIVLKAQMAALDAIKPDVRCCDIDRIARDIITCAGYGKCFGHGSGHSVGLEIHEAPACNTRDETPLLSGMIMTVEPGIYIENQFGVRIEDMVLVTEKGYENLTHSPKELIII